jgi:hypothetical protein
VRVANNGVAADWTYLGAFPEVNADGNWELYNSTDPTKELKFDLSGLPTGTTRTVTGPAGNGQMMVSGQAGSFTTLAANNGTLTASAPVLDLAQTWNNAAVTFTGIRFNATNTASATASPLIDLQVGGVSRMRMTRGGTLHLSEFSNSGFYSPAPIWHGSTAGLLAATNLAIGSTLDTILERGGAGIIEQRNAANAQEYRIFNTFTSATNHERGFLKWSSNVFQIGTEKGSGGGAARGLEFQTDGVTRFSISDAGAVRVIGALRVGPNFNSGSLVVQHGDGVEAFRCQYNATFDFAGRVFQMGASGTGGTIQIHTDGDNLMALRRGTNAQNLRIYNTVSGTNNVNFDRVNFRWASNEFILDAEAGGTGILRGIKIGSATSSLLGFFGATPVVQQAAVADATDAASTQARLNDLLARLRTLGLIAT